MLRQLISGEIHSRYPSPPNSGFRKILRRSNRGEAPAIQTGRIILYRVELIGLKLVVASPQRQRVCTKREHAQGRAIYVCLFHVSTIACGGTIAR
jgi:hypothetical protein